MNNLKTMNKKLNQLNLTKKELTKFLQHLRNEIANLCGGDQYLGKTLCNLAKEIHKFALKNSIVLKKESWESH